MMNKVQEKINVILMNIVHKYLEDDYLRISGIHSVEDKKDYIEKKPSNFRQNNKSVMDLSNVYRELSPSDKELFISVLNKYIEPDNSSDICSVCFKTLLHLGENNLSLNILKRIFDVDEELTSGFLDVLSNTIRYSWHTFADSELSDIQIWIDDLLSDSSLNSLEHFRKEKDWKESLEYIWKQSSAARYEKINPSLASPHDIAIDYDRDNLIQKFQSHKFPKDLTQAIYKIEKSLNSSVDNFDFQSCMGLIRSFLERLYEELSLLLGAESKIDGKETKKIMKLFKDKGLISEELAGILIGMRHFLSNWGTHRLKSRSDDARISKNMVIELALYLMKRYESMK